MKSNSGLEKGHEIISIGKFFPWIIVILGAMLLFSSNAYNQTFGVFFKPITNNFGWTRATMSGAFAIRSLVCAVFVVPMGYWADRIGPRWVLMPCFILLGAGMIAIAKVTTIWQLYLIQGAGIGIGMSGPFVCIMSTVAKWHESRRGLALGIASAGTGLSSIIFPLVATQLIQAKGWQFAIFIIGLIILAIGIPASLIMKDPPNKIKRKLPSNDKASRGLFDILGLLPQFLKKPAFLSIIIMFMLIGAIGNMLYNHLVNYATDIGITALVAAGMMSAMGVASTIGRLGIGAISDRIGTKRDTAMCCILLAVSCLLLVSKVPALMWVAAALFGIGFGGSMPLVPAIMGERVGIEQLSTATGVGSIGIFIGAALGPWLGGFIYDVSGSYLWALLLAAGAGIAALIITIRMPSARQEIL
jgi:MFS family permease